MSNSPFLDPRSLGAKADGTSNDTAALQAAIDQAASTGQVVLLHGGTYVTGTVFLKSNVTIEIQASAVWEAIPDLEHFPFIDPAVPSRMDSVAWRAFLYAANEENIHLRGDGEIHGRGDHPVFKEDLKGNDPRRPYGLHFVNCRNVSVEGLRLRNSAFWMQRYLNCEGLTLRGLTVWNHAETRNNDGCDIDGCRDVVVSDCRIDSTDDALCLKSEGAQICENIAITNCVLSSFASPLKFGTGSVGGFRQIAVSNLVIRPSQCPDCHHVFNAMGGLSGIDIGCVDGGFFEQVTISNIAMRGVETVIFMKLGERLNTNLHRGPFPGSPEATPGHLRHVKISHITADDAGPYPCIIVGYEGNPIQDISLTDVTIQMGHAAVEQPAWELDLGPKVYPVNRNIGSLMPAYGLYAAHVTGLRLRDLVLRPATGDPRPAIGLQNTHSVRMEGLDLLSQNHEPIVVRDSQEVHSPPAT